MIHLRSEERINKTQPPSVAILQKTIQGSYRCIDYHIDDGAIPWVWDPVNVLKIRENFGSEIIYTITFPEFSLTDVVSVTAFLFAQLDLQMNTGVSIVSVLFNATTRTYDILFNDNHDILWDDPDSSLQSIFHESSETNVIGFSLKDYFIGKPDFLICSIAEANPTFITGNGVKKDLEIRTSGPRIKTQIIHFAEKTNTLTTTWFRNHVNVSCPFQRNWDLILFPIDGVEF